MSDPFESEEWQQLAQHALDNLVPAVQQSAISISLLPKGKPDIKFALELGMSVMLDKPIIAVVHPGSKVPGKVIAVADEIVEGALDDPTLPERMKDAMLRVMKRRGIA